MSAAERTGVDSADRSGSATRLDQVVVAGGLALATGAAVGLVRAGMPSLRQWLVYLRDQQSNRTRVPFVRSVLPPDGVSA